MAVFTTRDRDSDSDDFGYDFSADEELLLLQLASNDPAPSTTTTTVTDDDRTSVIIDAVPGKTDSVADHEQNALDLGGRSASSLPGRTPTTAAQDVEYGALPSPVSISDDVVYPNLSNALSNLETETPQPEFETTTTTEDQLSDDRSPLQRFRSYPRRPLTVTDLTSGAWCELQYWYTLTRLPGGRRTRTKAMRQGSKVHQKLEDEVHTTVKVDIMTKEDGFGLRLWNLVQGLRTLRDTGLTRELEVWGMVDGNLVNGVIDSVSHQNPNPEFEEELSSQESQADGKQSSLTDYFPPKKSDKAARATPKVYLADVKTRGSLAPVSAAQLRPAKIQLLLYHRFLSEIAAEELNFDKVFRRYGLDADDHFSDSFVAQVGALHDEIFVDAPSSTDESSSKRVNKKAAARYEPDEDSSTETEPDIPVPDMLKYRSLRELLSLVQDEVKLTFPLGADSLGHMLRVQYLHRDDGRELDLHDFPVSRQALDVYLSKYMPWWRGERKATGVDIEEAGFKCKMCEFVKDCSWRQGMDEGRVKKAQQKMWAARRTAGA